MSERLQAEKQRIEVELSLPATYADGLRVAALQRELAFIGKQLAELEEAWLEAAARIEALENGACPEDASG